MGVLFSKSLQITELDREVLRYRLTSIQKKLDGKSPNLDPVKLANDIQKQIEIIKTYDEMDSLGRRMTDIDRFFVLRKQVHDEHIKNL
jgi:hypothetical protein